MRLLLGILQALLLLAYPALVYFGLSHFSARGVGAVVLLLLLPGLVRTWREKRRQLTGTLGLAGAIAVLMLLAMAFNRPGFVLAYPALFNAAMLLQFAWSLRSTPMVERFARLQVDDLAPREVAYCRKVTVFWSGFFVVNGGLCGALAVWAPRAWWALYTGVLGYLLLAFFFACEFTLRKYLFRRPPRNLLDRAFAVVFPPPASPPARLPPS